MFFVNENSVKRALADQHAEKMLEALCCVAQDQAIREKQPTDNHVPPLHLAACLLTGLPRP